ncbi:MAG: hypothetical protein ABI353_14610 [Isosphaeraceae bacterium]
MPTTSDDNKGLPRTRRFRIDDCAGSRPIKHKPGTSGRWFVIGSLLVIVLVWSVMYALFLYWSARHYKVLAGFGAAEVATTVDSLARLSPPGIPRAAWHSAVADTHKIIENVTASGPLSRSDLEALRNNYTARVAAARTDSAVATLAGIWGDLELKAGPVLQRRSSPQPAILVLSRTIDPLARDLPAGVSVANWNQALAATRVLLVDLAASHRLNLKRQEDLRAWWTLRVAAARPETVVAVLTKVWDQVEVEPGAKPVLARHPRPALLGGQAVQASKSSDSAS